MEWKDVQEGVDDTPRDGSTRNGQRAVVTDELFRRSSKTRVTSVKLLEARHWLRLVPFLLLKLISYAPFELPDLWTFGASFWWHFLSCLSFQQQKLLKWLRDFLRAVVTVQVCVLGWKCVQYKWKDFLNNCEVCRRSRLTSRCVYSHLCVLLFISVRTCSSRRWARRCYVTAALTTGHVINYHRYSKKTLRHEESEYWVLLLHRQKQTVTIFKTCKKTADRPKSQFNKVAALEIFPFCLCRDSFANHARDSKCTTGPSPCGSSGFSASQLTTSQPEAGWSAASNCPASTPHCRLLACF